MTDKTAIRPSSRQPPHPLILPDFGVRDLVTQDINVLALVKGSERYIFLYDDGQRAEALRTFGRFASNPDLTFSWYDAAVLSQKLRAETHRAKRQDRFSLPQPSDKKDLF